MRLNYLKQKIRGWLPPQPSNPSRLKHYSAPIVIGLAIAVLSVSFFVVSSTFFFQSSALKPIPIDTNSDNSTNPIIELTPTPSPLLTPTPTSTSTLITKDQALSIAMPIIQQYANEHNRTIESVNATLARSFWAITANFTWTGPPSPVPVYDENGTVTGFRYLNDPDAWIFGYVVDVQIDNGQITDSCAYGIM